MPPSITAAAVKVSVSLRIGLSSSFFLRADQAEFAKDCSGTATTLGAKSRFRSTDLRNQVGSAAFIRDLARRGSVFE
jgi:hypothetical protein